jgi:hypothetical protein
MEMIHFMVFYFFSKHNSYLVRDESKSVTVSQRASQRLRLFSIFNRFTVKKETFVLFTLSWRYWCFTFLQNNEATIFYFVFWTEPAVYCEWQCKTCLWQLSDNNTRKPVWTTIVWHQLGRPIYRPLTHQERQLSVYKQGISQKNGLCFITLL